MEKKIVIVSGKKRDKYGMPLPFYFYGVFASSYKKEDKNYIAVSRIGVSQGIPADTEGVKLIESPSEKCAIDKVISELKNHFKNKGLKVRVCDFPKIAI